MSYTTPRAAVSTLLLIKKVGTDERSGKIN